MMSCNYSFYELTDNIVFKIDKNNVKEVITIIFSWLTIKKDDKGGLN